MRQLIALTALVVALVILRGATIAQAAADGNWGGALGVLLGGAFAFYAVLGAFVLLRRLVRRGGAPFAETRLNYVSLAIALAVSLAAPPP